MAVKKNRYTFTISFNPEFPEQKKVAEYLNRLGRTKALEITRVFADYWRNNEMVAPPGMTRAVPDRDAEETQERQEENLERENPKEEAAKDGNDRKRKESPRPHPAEKKLSPEEPFAPDPSEKILPKKGASDDDDSDMEVDVEDMLKGMGGDDISDLFLSLQAFD